jgi:hypothetical protein
VSSTQIAALQRLGEIHEAAVERIGGPDLSRIRRHHHMIPLRGIEIDRGDHGEAIENERQGPSGGKVGFVGQAKMQVGAQRRAGVPDLGATE